MKDMIYCISTHSLPTIYYATIHALINAIRLPIYITENYKYLFRLLPQSESIGTVHFQQTLWS